MTRRADGAAIIDRIQADVGDHGLALPRNGDAVVMLRFQPEARRCGPTPRASAVLVEGRRTGRTVGENRRHITFDFDGVRYR